MTDKQGPSHCLIVINQQTITRIIYGKDNVMGLIHQLFFLDILYEGL